MSRLHTALAYSWGWAARVVLLASWVLALSGETRAAVILTDIDARVSTGAYSVTVASGAAPLVRLNYSEHTQYAQFFLDSLAFDEPFSLAGRIGGDEWNMEFTLTGQTDDPAARFLTLGFTGQHVVANYPSQPPTGPPLSGGGFLSTGTGVYLGSPGLYYLYMNAINGWEGGYGMIGGHGPNRSDLVLYDFWGIERDSRIAEWHFQSEFADVPEPATATLLLTGLAVMFSRRSRRT